MDIVTKKVAGVKMKQYVMQAVLVHGAEATATNRVAGITKTIKPHVTSPLIVNGLLLVHVLIRAAGNTIMKVHAPAPPEKPAFGADLDGVLSQGAGTITVKQPVITQQVASGMISGHIVKK